MHQALKEKQLKFFGASESDVQHAGPDSCCSSLAWLLGALSKRWGIMQLAARLDLQQALLAAEEDTTACYILIQAGARITHPLINKSGINAGPAIWAQAYLRYGLSWSLPRIFLPALLRDISEYRSLMVSAGNKDLDSQLLFEAVAATLKAQPESHTLLKLFLDKRELHSFRKQWSPEQILELALLAVKQRRAEALESLLQLPALQQVAAAQAQQLLVRAAANWSVQAVLVILEHVPAARALPVEGLQQMFAACIDGDRWTNSKATFIWEIARSGMFPVQQLGQQEVQLLMMKCIGRHAGMALHCMKDHLPAAKQVPFAAICELMLQAAAAGASSCLKVLLQLVPQLRDLPLAVLQQVLPLLMDGDCRIPSRTPGSVVGNEQNMHTASTCSTCSLLAEAGDKLAAADVWEVLVAAARAPVEQLHLEGLACLPGVDELGEEQVEQLLVAAIEAVPVSENEFELEEEEQPLLKKLKQLQGKLLFNKQLPYAAVHRLMVACVGKAVEGGVGRLREELGLQGKGELSSEQLKQLLLVAVQCSIKKQDRNGGEHVAGCRPCLLVLAKLLPSVREQQQVTECLKELGGFPAP